MKMQYREDACSADVEREEGEVTLSGDITSNNVLG
jgi:hypothetical protein